MKKQIGTYITKKVAGESYKVYIPALLPPVINLEKSTGFLFLYYEQ